MTGVQTVCSSDLKEPKEDQVAETAPEMAEETPEAAPDEAAFTEEE